MRVRSATFLVPFLAVSCATVEKRVETKEQYVRTDVVDRGKKYSPGVAAVFEVAPDFSDGVVRLDAFRVDTCSSTKRNVYSRIETTKRDYTHYLLVRLGDREVQLVVGGIALAGVFGAGYGAYRLYEAPSLSNEPRVNENGDELRSEQDLAYGDGAGGLAIGIPLVALAAWEGVRGRDTTKNVGEFVKDEVDESRDCGTRTPLTGRLALGPRRVDLGTTDANGRVTFDVRLLAIADLAENEPVFLGEEQIGTLEAPPELRDVVSRAAALSSAGKAHAAAFLRDHPKSFAAAEAKRRLDSLTMTESADFASAMRSPTIASLSAALAKHPDADPPVREAAETKLRELEFAEAAKVNTPAALNAFAAKYPDSDLATRALHLADESIAAKLTEGYQNVRWGMSLADVKRSRPGMNRSLEGVDFEATEVASEKANVAYVFTKSDRLGRVIVWFDVTYVNANNYVSLFSKLRDLLTKKYGTPSVDR